MASKLRPAFAAGASCLALLGAPAAAETLADALALAYQTNPTLHQQRAQLRALDENYVQARAGFRPRAEAGATTTYTNTRTRFGTTDGGNLGLTLDAAQPLYTGGRASAAVAASEGDIRSGREQLRGTENDVFQAVIQAYVDVRRDEASLGIRRENVNVLLRQLDEVRARFEVGEITRTDVAQAEARLAASQSLASQAQAQLAISRATYAALVGQAPGTLEPEPALPSIPATLAQAFEVAETNNPDILAADYAFQASRARVAAARAETRPSASLQGRLGYDSTLSNIGSDIYTRTATVAGVLNVPIFTGGLTSSRIRQAAERNNADRIAVEGNRRQALQRVAQAWSAMQAARAAQISNEEQVRAARVAFEGVQAEAQVGLRTTIDVLNAQQELRNAELALVNSRRDAYVAGASLLNAMGLLDASLMTPGLEIYDPVAAFNRVRNSAALPWEPLVSGLDRVGAPRIETPRGPVVTPPVTTPAPPASAQPAPAPSARLSDDPIGDVLAAALAADG